MDLKKLIAQWTEEYSRPPLRAIGDIRRAVGGVAEKWPTDQRSRCAKDAIKLCTTHVERERWTRAYAALIIAMVLDPGQMQKAERSRIFVGRKPFSRSHHGLLRILTEEGAAALEEACPGLSERVTAYANLDELISAFAAEHKMYNLTLMQRPEGLLKALLAVADLAFLVHESEPDRARLLEEYLPDVEPEIATKEYWSELVSQCIAEAAELSPITHDEINAEPYTGTQHPIWKPFLRAAAIRVRLYEFIKHITVLGYVLEKRMGAGRVVYVLKPPQPEFEFFLRLGTIRQQMRAATWLSVGGGSGPIVSMFQTARLLTARYAECKIVEQPYPRYVLLAPLPDEKLLSLSFYEDGVTELETVYELVTRPGTLMKIDVAPSLTVKELVGAHRAMRMFCFMHSAMLSQVHPEERTIINTLPVVLQEHQAVGIISASGMPADSLNAYLRCMSWPNKPGSRLDLQYTPLLNVSGEIIFSPRIVAHSAAVRNVLAQTTSRSPQAPTEFVAMIAAILRSRFAHVATEKEVEFGSRKTDVDVVALAGGTLYLIECKHSLPGASVHEFGDLLQDVKKGVQQLRVAQHILQKDPNVHARLSAWFPDAQDADLSFERVCSVVVTSLRELGGMHYDGIPIRDVFTLRNIVWEGIVEVAVAEEMEYRGMRWRVWSGEEFQQSDLDDYLCEGGALLAINITIYETDDSH